mmetsp:Transcript_92343/g.193083  ORF Transcript_92343/g.193083 Transcript_92343/m.193083 type:complete len:202 (-) Transcript_92343:175-780(-)
MHYPNQKRQRHRHRKRLGRSWIKKQKKAYCKAGSSSHRYQSCSERTMSRRTGKNLQWQKPRQRRRRKSYPRRPLLAQLQARPVGRRRKRPAKQRKKIEEVALDTTERGGTLRIGAEALRRRRERKQASMPVEMTRSLRLGSRPPLAHRVFLQDCQQLCTSLLQTQRSSSSSCKTRWTQTQLLASVPYPRQSRGSSSAGGLW